MAGEVQKQAALAEWRRRDAEGRAARAAEREGERRLRQEAWARDHTAELERRRLARAAEREAKVDEWKEHHAADYEDDDAAFERTLAEAQGITVEQLREIQRQRRAEMQGKPKFGYAPDHEVR